MTFAKAELHLHLEGTLEPETIFRLADRNRIRLPYADVSELAARYEFTDLQSFLDLYYANMAVLQSAEDFFEMTEAYLARAAVAGVCHAEVHLDPQAHLARGVALEIVMEGVSAALESAEHRHGISTGLIIAMLRDHSAESAMKTLDAVLAMGTPIIGIGLDSTEIGISPSKFVDVFAKAQALGLHRVAHAGEEGPPENIWQALDLLKAERIDHGIRSMEDEALVSRLASQRIPLTVCPLSNVRLKVVDSVLAHPLPEMMRRGLLVTVNSDDPAYFGGYVDDNFAALDRTFGLTDEEEATLARNSITASFLDDARKSGLYAAIADEQAHRAAQTQPSL
jgi:adenosine deaminase